MKRKAPKEQSIKDREIQRLQNIITRAMTHFCSDGSDGEIAAGMFRILCEMDRPDAVTLNNKAP